MSRVALIGSVVFAVLLPLLVWWASALLARALSSFSAQIEIDRSLREDPARRRGLLWTPWRRERLAIAHWHAMPPGEDRDRFGAMLARHRRALDLQGGLYSIFALGSLFTPGLSAWGRGVMLLLALGTWWWRWTARRWGADAIR